MTKLQAYKLRQLRKRLKQGLELIEELLPETNKEPVEPSTTLCRVCERRRTLRTDGTVTYHDGGCPGSYEPGIEGSNLTNAERARLTQEKQAKADADADAKWDDKRVEWGQDLAKLGVTVPVDEYRAKLVPISGLRLSTRTKSGLEQNNVRTLWDISQLSWRDLRRVRGFGSRSIEESDALLRLCGIPWRKGF